MRTIEKELKDIHNELALIKTNLKVSTDLLNERINELEARMEKDASGYEEEEID